MKTTRVFDIIFSLAALIILSPIFLIVSIVILIDSGTPIFFVQNRVGKKCKEFKLFKFRSMVHDLSRNFGSFPDSETSNIKNAYQTTQINDPRITATGKYLRKLSLDELPQLINVLKGDMSLVGPRPDAPIQKNNYESFEWLLRHSVLPGITGLAQVNGRSMLTEKDRLFYDLHYIHNFSIKLYFTIILKTFFSIFKTKNIN